MQNAAAVYLCCMMKTAHPEIARQIAGRLLEIGAIKLQPEKPFTWASGWQSPIYCDNRLTLSFPEHRTYIKAHLVAQVNEHFLTREVVAGVATAGIPQGALVADAMNVPFVYVRSKPKGHGMENLIEGKVEPGKKVLVVEDLVSTGGSSLKAVEALRAAGYEVLGMLSIFTYGFDVAAENFEKAGVDYISLSSYEYMIEEALAQKYISESQVKTLQNWRKDPANWTP